MIELDSDNLGEMVKENTNVFVQYGAAWCGNCRMLKPKVKQFSEKYSDISFIYVDAEKFPESRKLATVDNLPTYAAFRDGQLVKQAQGNKLDIIQGVIDEIAGN